MILIISSVDDVSTNQVIDWLLFYKIAYLRITDSDLISIKKIEFKNYEKPDIVFKVKNITYNLSAFKNIWFRRGWIIHDKSLITNLSKKITTLKTPLINQLNSEIDDLTKFFIQNIEEESLNKISDTKLNKLQALKFAQEMQILIPESIITDEKKDVLLFLKKHKKIITKNCTQGVFVYDKDYMLNVYTLLLNKNEI